VQEPELTLPQPTATAVLDDPVASSRPSAASMIVFEAVTKVYEPDVTASNTIIDAADGRDASTGASITADAVGCGNVSSGSCTSVQRGRRSNRGAWVRRCCKV